MKKLQKPNSGKKLHRGNLATVTFLGKNNTETFTQKKRKKQERISNNALASVRNRLRLTQGEMSLKLGISLSLLKLVETGRRTLSFEPLLKLAQLEIDLAKHRASPGELSE